MPNKPFRVDSARWERTRLILGGTAPGAGWGYYLHNGEGIKIALENTLCADGRFELVLYSVCAYNKYPLPTGLWRLMACDGAGNAAHAAWGMDGDGLSRVFEQKRAAYSLSPEYGHPEGFALRVSYIRRRGMGIGECAKALLFWAAGVLFGVFGLFNRRGRGKILFTSNVRDSLEGNLEFVYRRMVERGLDKSYKLCLHLKNESRGRPGIFSNLRLVYLLAGADIVLTDDYHPLIYHLPFDKGVKVLQLWHACGAFKLIGYSRLGRPGAPAIDGVSHKTYTKAIVSADYAVPHHAEAFALKERDVAATGIPRTDIFFDEAYARKTRRRLYEMYPQIRGKRVILFAPTFRGINRGDAAYPCDRIDFDGLERYCRARNAVVLFKMHPFVGPMPALSGRGGVFADISSHREINDFLFVADALITDYSSVIFEYSVFEKPMYFFAYDLEEYDAERGFFEPYEDFVPGPVARTFGELLSALKEDFDPERIRAFCRRNFKYTDGKSSDRVIDELILK